MLLNNWSFWGVLGPKMFRAPWPSLGLQSLRTYGSRPRRKFRGIIPPSCSNAVRATHRDRQGFLPLPNGNAALRDLKVFRGSFPIGTKWRPWGRAELGKRSLTALRPLGGIDSYSRVRRVRGVLSVDRWSPDCGKISVLPQYLCLKIRDS